MADRTSGVTSDVVIEGGILVGHDGSRASGEAVLWAAELASRLGETLHVLRAWSLTNAPRPKTMEGGYIPPKEDFEEAVLDALAKDIEALGLSSQVDVQLHAAHGSAGSQLLEASRGSEMVVVGSRGVGGFRGLGFGSTADQVVRHASCPVVVVPTGKE